MNILKKFVVVFCLCVLSGQVYAHKLNVFAFVEGDAVNVEGYFSDGILAKNAKVTVTDIEGNLIDEGRADTQGQYQFQATNNADLLIKIDAGLGHIASYQLGSEEVSNKAPEGESTINTASASSSADVQKAVAEAVKPLAREIAELKQKTRMSDIIGGIGYILGILGLFAYLKYRKESQTH